LFGGGTKMDLELDLESVPQGGFLSGRVLVQGGKKPLRITSLSVRVGKLKVELKEGASLPDVHMESVVEGVIASNEPLPPGAPKRFDFRLRVPSDVEPSRLGVSYKVVARADIPGVADPSADAKVKIVEGSVSDELTVEEILERWPNLASNDDALEEALRELHNACYSQRETLLAAESLLIQRFLGASSAKVKRLAFRTWANLVDNQVRPDHLRLLSEFAAQKQDAETIGEILTAVAKFAEEGTLPMVQQFSQHPDPELRAKLANELWSNARNDFPGKREVLNRLVADAEPAVRAAAITSLRFGYYDDAALMRWFATVVDQDQSAEVQAACLGALSRAHNHGLGELGLDVYERHLSNPSELVRQKLAESLDGQPEAAGPRVLRLVERLLADPDEEVRKTMAFQICNLEEFPAVAKLAQQSAQNDPSERVRQEALQAMAHVMPVAELIPYYERILANNPSERVWRGVIRGADRQIKEPAARAFLERLAAEPSERGAYARSRLA
jgi:hypothetical protein